MILAKLYRNDRATRAPSVYVGYVLIGRGGLAHMHLAAEQAVHRTPGAVAYRLYEGRTMATAKPVTQTIVVIE